MVFKLGSNLNSDEFSLVMQINERGSGWEDLIFIPPGKSHFQHIKEVKS